VVNVSPPSVQNPMSANVRFSFRYVRSIVDAAVRSFVLIAAALCRIRTSSPELGYGNGLMSTE
jgi:hypothetical protein